MKQAAHLLLVAALWLVLLLLSVWAAAALYFAFPVSALRAPTAITYLLAIVVIAGLIRSRRHGIAFILAGFGLVLAWWLTLQPGNDRSWKANVARTASAQITGDNVTLRNVRNFDYRTEEDYTPRWETRSMRLSDLTGIDFFLVYWGSPWIAHTIASFTFANTPPVAISIETRLENNEQYSASAGFFRRFELIYIVADERDVIRLRTNYRKDEDVYLFHLNVTPARAREVFLSYLRTLNALDRKAEFYNALVSNCTTNIRVHAVDSAHGTAQRWGWRLLLNGKLDERAYELGTLDRSLPFAELKRRSLINPVARSVGDSPDFSQMIRVGLPGF